VNTAIKQLLAYLVGIGMLGGSLAQAQQIYVPKVQAHSIMSQRNYDALRVAQQPAPIAQPDLPSNLSNPTALSDGNVVPEGVPSPATPALAPPKAIPEGTPPTAPNGAYVPQSVPQGGAEGEFTTGFPGLSPSGQPANAMPPHVPGIENGLWDGCEPGNCCSICGGGYCQPPLWFTDQEVRIINRSRPRRVTLGTQFTQVTSTITGQQTVVSTDVFNTRSVNYDVAPGYYTTIGRYLGRDSQDRDDFLEFTYWGMNTWIDSNFINAQRVTDSTTFFRSITFGNLFSPFPSDVGGFNRQDSQTINISSEMHNWELNLRLRPRGRPDQLVMQPNGRWRRECAPGTYMSYLVGLRYMTIGDGFIWNTRGLFRDAQTGDHVTSGNYTVQTENDLLGLQMGADLIFRRCKWSWGVHSKVGPYVNFARSMQEIKTQGAGDPFALIELNDRFNTLKHKVALIGEVGFEANYKFTPNMTGRVAYDFMWINGLALAPEQLQFTDTPESTINTNGSIFSQGLTMGLEWNW
jgi:hypothetical protein